MSIGKETPARIEPCLLDEEASVEIVDLVAALSGRRASSACACIPVRQPVSPISCG